MGGSYQAEMSMGSIPEATLSSACTIHPAARDVPERRDWRACADVAEWARAGGGPFPNEAEVSPEVERVQKAVDGDEKAPDHKSAGHRTGDEQQWLGGRQ